MLGLKTASYRLQNLDREAESRKPEARSLIFARWSLTF